MSNLRLLPVLLLMAGSIVATRAEEGMWTLNNFPSEKVKQEHGFAPDARWLDHVRLSTARYGFGCSSSFVSPAGLLMTNHHCASACIQDLSTPQTDYLSNGFYAPSAAEEKRCPGLEVNRLESIQDVTNRVNAATKGQKDEGFTKAFNAAKAKISKECATSENIHCEVVTLYSGGRYDLYKYRRFSDVRLVFAPEKGIAFFGGDPDNFMFPRYDLDVTFLRVYDNGSPIESEHYFKWSPKGAQEGMLTFITGNPGSTQRELTVAELEFMRDWMLPDARVEFAELRGVLRQFQTKGPEQKRISQIMLFGTENTLKAITGQHEALLDKNAFARKVAREREFRQKIESDPRLRSEYGGAWAAIAAAMDKQRTISTPYSYLERNRGFRSRLYTIARTLVRAAEELPKGNESRLPEFADAGLPALKAGLFSAAPIYDELEIETLSFSLTKLREALGPDDPMIRAVFGPRSPREIAEEAVNGTKLKDPARRKELFEGGKGAMAGAADDTMIRLAKLVDPYARKIRTSYEQDIEGVVRKNRELLGRAAFAVYGTSTYPDATLTLRISYGTVKGWEENGKTINPITIIGGAFERHTGREPYALPESWLKAKDQLDMSKPMNFVTTTDVIGGNSGSPAINKDAEIVGIVFDGNIHSLGGAFWFDETKNRTVSVHSELIMEALRKVYRADRLVEELRPR